MLLTCQLSVLLRLQECAEGLTCQESFQYALAVCLARRHEFALILKVLNRFSVTFTLFYFLLQVWFCDSVGAGAARAPSAGKTTVELAVEEAVATGVVKPDSEVGPLAGGRLLRLPNCYCLHHPGRWTGNIKQHLCHFSIGASKAEGLKEVQGSPSAGSSVYLQQCH